MREWSTTSSSRLFEDNYEFTGSSSKQNVSFVHRSHMQLDKISTMEVKNLFPNFFPFHFDFERVWSMTVLDSFSVAHREKLSNFSPVPKCYHWATTQICPTLFVPFCPPCTITPIVHEKKWTTFVEGTSPWWVQVKNQYCAPHKKRRALLCIRR